MKLSKEQKRQLSSHPLSLSDEQICQVEALLFLEPKDSRSKFKRVADAKIVGTPEHRLKKAIEHLKSVRELLNINSKVQYAHQLRGAKERVVSDIKRPIREKINSHREIWFKYPIISDLFNSFTRKGVDWILDTMISSLESSLLKENKAGPLDSQIYAYIIQWEQWSRCYHVEYDEGQEILVESCRSKVQDKYIIKTSEDSLFAQFLSIVLTNGLGQPATIVKWYQPILKDRREYLEKTVEKEI